MPWSLSHASQSESTAIRRVSWDGFIFRPGHAEIQVLNGFSIPVHLGKHLPFAVEGAQIPFVVFEQRWIIHERVRRRAAASTSGVDSQDFSKIQLPSHGQRHRVITVAIKLRQLNLSELAA